MRERSLSSRNQSRSSIPTTPRDIGRESAAVERPWTRYSSGSDDDREVLGYRLRDCGSTPAKVRKSVIRNDPSLLGSVGRQRGRTDEVRARVGLQQADEDLGDDATADRAEVQPVGEHLGLLEHVVPERRADARSRRRAARAPRSCGRSERPDAHRAGDALAGRELPGQVPEQVALRQRRRRVVARDRAERQVEERRRDLRVDLLVRLHLAVAEVEEGLPADEPPRRAHARRGDRPGRPCRSCEGSKTKREERLAVVAGEIRAIRGPHHAVAHAVGGGLELDRDEGLAARRPVEAPPRRRTSSTIRRPTISGRNSCTISHW